LTVKLELIDPQRVGDEEIVVDPGQEIRFRCVAEGRPAPSLSYTWLPVDGAESGQVIALTVFNKTSLNSGTSSYPFIAARKRRTHLRLGYFTNFNIYKTLLVMSSTKCRWNSR
jgi:hypothetical protein